MVTLLRFRVVCFTGICISKHKHLLDMSSIQLEGMHTLTKRGGETVGYQGRKKCKTSNMLIITDNQGVPLSCSNPISGNHNDAHDLVKTVDKMILNIQEESNI